jgi:quinol monooxygenase YgiN
MTIRRKGTIMVVVRVAVQVKSEERVKFLEQVKRETVEIQRFEGLLKFKVYEDPLAVNSFLLYEEWHTVKDFNAYKYSDFFKQNGQIFNPMMAGKPDSAYYSAEVIA